MEHPEALQRKILYYQKHGICACGPKCSHPSDYLEDNSCPKCHLPKHRTCGVLVSEANGAYWCHDCYNQKSGLPQQVSQTNTRRSGRSNKAAAAPPLHNRAGHGSLPPLSSSSSSSSEDDLLLASLVTRKTTKKKLSREENEQKKVDASKAGEEKELDSLVHYPGGGMFPCAAGTFCKSKGRTSTPVCGRHRCQTCGITIHNISGCGVYQDSDPLGRSDLTYCHICLKCINSKPSASAKTTLEFSPPAAAQKTNKKKQDKNKGDQPRTQKPKATKPKAKQKATKTKTAPKKFKMNRPKQVAPTIPNLSPVAFNLEPELMQPWESSWIVPSKVPEMYGTKINGHLYLLGAIVKCNNQKQGLYEIEFQHSNMERMELQAFMVSEAIKLHNRLHDNSTTPGDRNLGIHPLSPAMEGALGNINEVDPRNHGEPIQSDYECDFEDADEEDSDTEERRSRESQFLNTDFELRFPSHEQYSSMEDDNSASASTATAGITWQVGGTVPSPLNLANKKQSFVPKKFKRHFSSPLSSLLAFFPIELWKLIVNRTNEYAKWNQQYSDKETFKDWRDTDLPEMMRFFSLLLRMTMQPTPGRPFDCAWSLFKAYMTLKRFKLLRSALCFNFKNTEMEANSNDQLYKVRPLLVTLKKTLGSYINPGTDLAVDEGSVACRSKYGRALIVYNPAKPTGKYHFRFYCLCEADYFNCLRLIVHTKTGCDRGDGFVDPTVPDDNETNHTSGLTKTTRLVLDLCKPLEGTGRVINMDNYYTSPELLIALRNKNVYARGTCRKNRRMFPHAVTFTNQECRSLPRGSAKMAVNQENGLVAFGWTDGNPVHFITSADGDDTGSVTRRIGATATKVSAPAAMAKYNRGMQGVDRFDQYVSLYSMAQRHPFKFWYKKMAMALFDFGLTNAELHYFMVHPDEKGKECHRFAFREQLCLQIEELNWNKFQNLSQKQALERLSGDGEEEESSAEDGTPGSNSTILCRFVDSSQQPPLCTRRKPYSRKTGGHDTSTPNDGPADGGTTTPTRQVLETLSHKGRSCHVCLWELNNYRVKGVMFCMSHHIRACMTAWEVDPPRLSRVPKRWYDEIENSSPEELQWLCPDREASCWEKAHKFYIPKGLWGKDLSTMAFSLKNTARIPIALSRRCPLYAKRDEWLVDHGIKSRRSVPPGRKKTHRRRSSTAVARLPQPEPSSSSSEEDDNNKRAAHKRKRKRRKNTKHRRKGGVSNSETEEEQHIPHSYGNPNSRQDEEDDNAGDGTGYDLDLSATTTEFV